MAGIPGVGGKSKKNVTKERDGAGNVTYTYEDGRKVSEEDFKRDEGDFMMKGGSERVQAGLETRTQRTSSSAGSASEILSRPKQISEEAKKEERPSLGEMARRNAKPTPTPTPSPEEQEGKKKKQLGALNKTSYRG